MKDPILKTKSHMTKNGYCWTLQIVGKVSHLIIRDNNLYLEEDSRSLESREYLIPINSKKDYKQIKKLFNHKNWRIR
jgi:NhaP-type Na+/H+ and K+/H+ antiporter